MTNPDYWFYLEPYTFIFHGSDHYIVYNTLNSEYIDSRDYNSATELLCLFYHNTGSYCIGISKKDIAKKTLTPFIRKVRNSFCGDIVKNTGKMPFIFKPILRIYTQLNEQNSKSDTLFGLNGLLHLHEITFYLENNCSMTCDGCNSFYKQFLHCTKTSSQSLQLNDYEKIFNQLDLCQLDKINIIPGEFRNNYFFNNFVKLLTNYRFKKNIIIPYNKFTFLKIPTSVSNSQFAINIIVHFPSNITKLNQCIKFYSECNPTWTFIITNETDISVLKKLDLSPDIKYEILPWYNKDNISFFKKYVFTDYDDIIATPINKQKIFRRQVLNENFFGKLTVFPSGEVFSNVNFSSIGNLLSNKLTEIVHNEIVHSKAWFKIRNEGECIDCVNKYLCPSVSNYEIAINKYNLCNIK